MQIPLIRWLLLLLCSSCSHWIMLNHCIFTAVWILAPSLLFLQNGSMFKFFFYLFQENCGPLKFSFQDLSGQYFEDVSPPSYHCVIFALHPIVGIFSLLFYWYLILFPFPFPVCICWVLCWWISSNCILVTCCHHQSWQWQKDGVYSKACPTSHKSIFFTYIYFFIFQFAHFMVVLCNNF